MDYKDVLSFAKILESNSSLQTVSLDCMNYLKLFFIKKIKFKFPLYFLLDTNITPIGMKSLVEALKINQSIQSLNINGKN